MWDFLPNFTTPKTLSIKDARLSVINLAFVGLAIAWMGFTIIWEQTYLDLATPVGSSNMWVTSGISGNFYWGPDGKCKNGPCGTISSFVDARQRFNAFRFAKGDEGYGYCGGASPLPSPSPQ